MRARHFSDKNQNSRLGPLFLINLDTRTFCHPVFTAVTQTFYLTTNMQIAFFMPIFVGEVLVHCSAPMKRKYSFCCFFVGRRWRCGSTVPTVVGSTSKVLRPQNGVLRVRVNKDEQVELNFIRRATTA